MRLLATIVMLVLISVPAMGGCFSPDETTMVYLHVTRYHILQDFNVAGGDDFCYNWRDIMYTVQQWQENVTNLAGGDEALFMQMLNITDDQRDGD